MGIFGQIIDMFGTRNRDKLIILRKQPGQRNLPWSAAVLLSKRLNNFKKVSVMIEAGLSKTFIFLRKSPSAKSLFLRYFPVRKRLPSGE